MASWLYPALKAILPHVGTIISAAAPVFTKKKVDEAASQTVVLAQQIKELQSAASQNAAHIKELASQLQSTVTALEQAAVLAERKHRQNFRMGLAAIVLSILALLLVAVLLLGK